MANLLGQPLAGLCAAVAAARTGSPHLDLQAKLAHLSEAPDSPKAALGAYLRDLLDPNSEPAPPTLGEPSTRCSPPSSPWTDRP